MNHHIMKEYLKWFDRRMRIKGKKALLLMDNFSAHKLAVEIMEEAKDLTNTKIKWLPPNATSIYQPLDQGIIQNWKTYVKRQFVIFMARTFDEGKDLSKEMSVLRAIRWGISAWEIDVTPRTIQNCWARSQAFNFGQFPRPPPNLWTESQDAIEQLRQGLYNLRNSGYLAGIPNLHAYISSHDERVEDDCSEDLVDSIVANYTQVEEEEEPENGFVELVEAVVCISHNDALTALHTLRKYEEQSEHGNAELLRILRAEEREIGTKLQGSRMQAKLDHYWLTRD